ncbi:MAG: chlorite dismutase family protein [Chloroflexi bacterium]|nr:chlorite dismutase family protein [Chloroflexota bacterium]
MPQEQRQFIKYNFYRVDPAWRRLPERERQEGKQQFLGVVGEFSEQSHLRSYDLTGLRGDVDFLLWLVAWEVETLQRFAVQLQRTGLGRYLTTPYSYLAMTRRSPYLGQHRHPGQEGASTTLLVSEAPYSYLIVYPFVKTSEWYRLPKEDRKRMMLEHFKIGHKYPSVHINTTYSYGLDDQEHVVAFEANDLAEFLELVMELREAEARPYTLRDTPIFTCVRKDLPEILDGLG